MKREPAISLHPAALTHLRLYCHAAVVGLVQQAVGAWGSLEEVGERFPFLIGYVNEMAAFGLAGVDLDAAPQRWRELLRDWEQQANAPLPLQQLAQQCELDAGDLVVLAGAALVDEDMRFCAVFSELHGLLDNPRPTLAMLDRWAEPLADVPPRRALALLQRGLLLNANDGAPLGAWCARLPPLLSQVLRGAGIGHGQPGLSYQAPQQALPLAQLILPTMLQQQLPALQVLLAEGGIDTLLLRGPPSNGRTSLIAALAAAQGKGLLLLAAPAVQDAALRALAPALAALLRAVTVYTGSNDLPAPSHGNWQALLLDPHQGCEQLQAQRSLLLELPLPDLPQRTALWRSALAELPSMQAQQFAAQQRLSSGNLLALAGAAATQARLAGRDLPTNADLVAASNSLDFGVLNTLAQPLPARGHWSQLVVNTDTADELHVLLSRCRHREQLQDQTQFGAGCGVRALLRGPSGTGKTLAARLLAAELKLPLFRVDLAAVMSKYVGETEKQLARLFDRAEVLDVILLFDEGDSLFGRRTSVGSASDRYANLETNFLLQRIESHQGIVLLTTNLADNIDSAFQRRMDVVVDFSLPDEAARLAIWQLHLPPDHQVPGDWLQQLAWRCKLSGGQIRNAAQHAQLLALANEGAVERSRLLTAVQREYRKAGAVCPLREG